MLLVSKQIFEWVSSVTHDIETSWLTQMTLISLKNILLIYMMLFTLPISNIICTCLSGRNNYVILCCWNVPVGCLHHYMLRPQSYIYGSDTLTVVHN